MKVFHGSLEIVSVPEIRTPNRRLDYGSGFYKTYKLVNQILLHTEKALSTLAFIEAKEVRS
ncbi:MAG: DUF3990 domain-containing protein [Bacteroides sp.]|nr:DUF3990 domain-containing protein [Ruminococcus flavefaciens]MCM1555323.1 DUF3990 domain-containing protein [Bacteroides sp.]